MMKLWWDRLRNQLSVDGKEAMLYLLPRPMELYYIKVSGYRLATKDELRSFSQKYNPSDKQTVYAYDNSIWKTNSQSGIELVRTLHIQWFRTNTSILLIKIKKD